MTRWCLAGLVALCVVAACSSSSGGDGGDAATTPSTIGRSGSKVLPSTDTVAIGAPLHAYAITYRVEEVEGDAVRTSTHELTVERPFRSRFDTDASSRRADFGYLATKDGGGPEVLTAAPAPAPGDVRTDLLFASDKGREVRTVAGRACQVHRLGAPVLTGIVVPLAESEGITADTCVDRDGLILEEVTFDDAQVAISRWVATTIDVSPGSDAGDFHFPGTDAKPATDGGGSLQPVEETSAPPGELWQLDAPPAGFTRKGRYAIVPPQAARPDDLETRDQVIAGVSDVFVRGNDVLVVEQGGTLGQVPPFGATPHSRLVDLGELAKTAEWFRTPTGAEVRVLIPPGRYVKVFGTLQAADVIAIARSLHPIEGKELVYL